MVNGRYSGHRSGCATIRKFRANEVGNTAVSEIPYGRAKEPHPMKIAHHPDTHQPITAVADAPPQAICPTAAAPLCCAAATAWMVRPFSFGDTWTTKARRAAAAPTPPNSNPAPQPHSPKPAAGGRPRPAHSPLRPPSPSGEAVATPTPQKKKKRESQAVTRLTLFCFLRLHHLPQPLPAAAKDLLEDRLFQDRE